MSDVESFLAGEGLGSKAFYRLARIIINFLCRVFWRVRVTGRENIPLTGAFVLAPVHRSNIDTMLACTVTPRRMRYGQRFALEKFVHRMAFLCAGRLSGDPRYRRP